MARSVSLSTLRTRVRRRSDLQNATARFPDSEVNDEINESLSQLYLTMMRIRGQDYYTKTSVITTSANVTKYALPSDFWELTSAMLAASSGLNVVLSAFTSQERGELTSTNYAWNGRIFRYRIIGKTSYEGSDYIEFLPTPAAGQVVTVYYLPAPAILDDDDATFDGVAGFEEWAVLDAAAKLLVKNARFDRAAALRQERDVYEGRIDSVSRRRDASRPAQVTDVWGNQGTPWRRLGRGGWWGL